MQTLTRKLKETLSINPDLDDGLKQLYISLADDSEFGNTVLTIMGDYEHTKREAWKGTLTTEEYSVKLSRFRYTLLQIIDSLSLADLAKEEVKVKHIRVLCQNEKDQRYMQHYCDRFHLQHCKVDVVTGFKEYENVDLIIFDNRSLSNKEEVDLRGLSKPEKRRLALMEEFLNGTNAYFIHFGPVIDLVEAYRDRMHAANSIFALYARIQEMLTFLKEIQIYKPEAAS